MGGKNAENNLGMMIHRAMMARNVSPMPRNYELFYDFIVGSNPALREDMRNLPNNPTQAQLDILIAKYLPQHVGTSFVDKMQGWLEKLATSLLAVTEKETADLKQFNEAVATAASKLTEGLDVETAKRVTEVMVRVGTAKASSAARAASQLETKSNDIQEMRGQLEKFKTLAHTDPLTNIGNRRAFDERLSRAYDKGVPQSKALILLDIDKFKVFNDRFGHPAGDRVLTHVSQIIRANVRNAHVSRIGGEEFAVLVEDVDEEEALNISERLRKAVSETSMNNGTTNFGTLTVSVGACMSENATSAQELYKKADEALYKSKENGRNKVTIASKGAPAAAGAAKGVASLAAPASGRKDYLLYKAVEAAEREARAPGGR